MLEGKGSELMLTSGTIEGMEIGRSAHPKDVNGSGAGGTITMASGIPKEVEEAIIVVSPLPSYTPEETKHRWHELDVVIHKRFDVEVIAPVNVDKVAEFSVPFQCGGRAVVVLIDVESNFQLLCHSFHWDAKYVLKSMVA